MMNDINSTKPAGSFGEKSPAAAAPTATQAGAAAAASKPAVSSSGEQTSNKGKEAVDSHDQKPAGSSCKSPAAAAPTAAEAGSGAAASTKPVEETKPEGEKVKGEKVSAADQPKKKNTTKGEGNAVAAANTPGKDNAAAVVQDMHEGLGQKIAAAANEPKKVGGYDEAADVKDPQPSKGAAEKNRHQEPDENSLAKGPPASAPPDGTDSFPSGTDQQDNQTKNQEQALQEQALQGGGPIMDASDAAGPSPGAVAPGTASPSQAAQEADGSKTNDQKHGAPRVTGAGAVGAVLDQSAGWGGLHAPAAPAASPGATVTLAVAAAGATPVGDISHVAGVRHHFSL